MSSVVLSYALARFLDRHLHKTEFVLAAIFPLNGRLGVWPALLVCGGSFAVVQFLVANYLGPALVDVAGGLFSLTALALFLRVWKPASTWHFAHETPPAASQPVRSYSRLQLFHAWMPIVLPPDLDAVRLQARFGLRRLIDSRERFNRQRVTQGLNGFYEQAFRMLASPVAKRAFDLDKEPPPVRDRYGCDEFGDSFLLARRLVEAGVRLVSIIWMVVADKVYNVWDNHSGFNGAADGYDALRKFCIPPLDRVYTALLDDLDQRGLLDETLVVAVGELGRTPKINKDKGRDHWGACQSALLAGGGIRGGQVYGASDKHAAFVKDKPVAPEDLIATIHHAMGLEPGMEIRDREGRPHRITEGTPVTALFG